MLAAQVTAGLRRSLLVVGSSEIPITGPSNASISRRSLTSAKLREPKEKPKPWNYKKYGYGSWGYWWDNPLKRIDENSKLIIVEGNIGSGKSSVAKKLAEEFDFLHLPEVNMDKVLINRYGKDARDVYHLLPERFRFFDVKMFYENPRHPNVAWFQYMMYFCKYEQYENALAHILNTGQGVVMEKCPHSDFAFVEAMYNKSCLSKDFYDYYYETRRSSLPFLHLEPHLVVYLDTTPETCMERVRKRGIDYELKSDVMDEEYLADIDKGCKKYLREDADTMSRVLIYDWNEPGDIEYMVDDIENADLGDIFDHHKGDRFESWHLPFFSWNWNMLRMYHTNKIGSNSISQLPHDVAEMTFHPDDMAKYREVMEETNFGKYQPGWNPDKDGFWRVLSGLPVFPLWEEFYYTHRFFDSLRITPSPAITEL